MKKIILFTAICNLLLPLLGGAGVGLAQNIGINATGAAPDAGAMLDVSATNKGVLVPRVNITNLAIIAPITGSATESMLVYNTNNTTGRGYYYWDNTQWVRLSIDGGDWQINGNNNTTFGTHFLGTTNAQGLDFRTNNIIRLRIPNANQIHANADGTPALPFYSWANDPNTGVYRIGADILGFSTNGVERMRIIANGNVGIRNAAPGNMLEMTNGGLNVGANSMANFDNLGIDGVALAGLNSGTANGFNAIEGITFSQATGFAPAGVFGLGIYQGALSMPSIGVSGHSNEWQGTGVQGSRTNSGGANNGWGGIFIADLGYTGAFINASDRRLKKDVSNISNALNLIEQLNPVSYFYNTNEYPYMGFSTEKEYGFIAQEVKNIIPEIVKEKYFPTKGTVETKLSEAKVNDNQLFYGIDYTRLIPIAIQGIKEQQEIIENQNRRIEALEKIVLELQKSSENK